MSSSTAEVASGTRPPGGHRLGRGLLLVVMCLVAVVMLYPFWFMIRTSLQTQEQFQSGSRGFSVSSWSKLFHDLPATQQMLNSAIICTCAILIILALSATAGFAFAKLQYRASTFVLLGIVAAMLVPMQSIIIPEYVNLSRLHLITSYAGAVLVYAALGIPFATFLMTTYYRGLPDELVEAGVVDGLSYVQVFARLALPLSVPALVTVTVLQFIQIWDDLLIGLLFVQNPDQRPITVGLAALSAGRVTDIPVLMAGSLLSAIPAILVFLFFQRHLVSGLTLGISK